MSSKTFAYYPGCSGAGTSRENDLSTRAVCAALDLRLKEIPDWNCCGSSPAHTVDHALSAALCSRNFSQAETIDLSNTLTPCPACLKNLHNALEHMHDPDFAAKVDHLTQRPLTREHSVKSVLQVIYEDVGPEELKKKIVAPLKGLKLVAYYGCLMTKPGRSMHFDDEENPVSMDVLMEACGASMLPFPLKVECCGASMGIPRNDVVARLSGRILQLADSLGADAIVVACPLCQMNLDMRQVQANAYYKTELNIPVFYYTQLMGLALGLPEKKLGLNKLIVSPEAVLEKLSGKDADTTEAKPDKANAKSRAILKTDSAKTPVKEEAGA